MVTRDTCRVTRSNTDLAAERMSAHVAPSVVVSSEAAGFTFVKMDGFAICLCPGPPCEMLIYCVHWKITLKTDVTFQWSRTICWLTLAPEFGYLIFSLEITQYCPCAFEQWYCEK